MGYSSFLFRNYLPLTHNFFSSFELFESTFKKISVCLLSYAIIYKLIFFQNFLFNCRAEIEGQFWVYPSQVQQVQQIYWKEIWKKKSEFGESWIICIHNSIQLFECLWIKKLKKYRHFLLLDFQKTVKFILNYSFKF